MQRLIRGGMGKLSKQIEITIRLFTLMDAQILVNNYFK